MSHPPVSLPLFYIQIMPNATESFLYTHLLVRFVWFSCIACVKLWYSRCLMCWQVSPIEWDLPCGWPREENVASLILSFFFRNDSYSCYCGGWLFYLPLSYIPANLFPFFLTFLSLKTSWHPNLFPSSLLPKTSSRDKDIRHGKDERTKSENHGFSASWTGITYDYNRTLS